VGYTCPVVRAVETGELTTSKRVAISGVDEGRGCSRNQASRKKKGVPPGCERLRVFLTGALGSNPYTPSREVR